MDPPQAFITKRQMVGLVTCLQKLFMEGKKSEKYVSVYVFSSNLKLLFLVFCFFVFSVCKMNLNHNRFLFFVFCFF